MPSWTAKPSPPASAASARPPPGSTTSAASANTANTAPSATASASTTPSSAAARPSASAGSTTAPPPSATPSSAPSSATISATCPPHLPANELALAHLVRDADKLDIYTVLDHAIETDYLPSHPDVYWGLPLDGPPSPAVVAALERGDSVDYADIRSFADFVFIQLAWCNGGLHYAASRRLALERGEVDVRRRYLRTLLPAHGAVIDRCCDIAAAALAK